jgi:hypothetical protein
VDDLILECYKYLDHEVGKAPQFKATNLVTLGFPPEEQFLLMVRQQRLELLREMLLGQR